VNGPGSACSQGQEGGLGGALMRVRQPHMAVSGLRAGTASMGQRMGKAFTGQCTGVASTGQRMGMAFTWQ